MFIQQSRHAILTKLALGPRLQVDLNEREKQLMPHGLSSSLLAYVTARELASREKDLEDMSRRSHSFGDMLAPHSKDLQSRLADVGASISISQKKDMDEKRLLDRAALRSALRALDGIASESGFSALDGSKVRLFLLSNFDR
ncbi:hypothetical protein QAD02_011554 [Eretmocerus hayati]|uniref:Uncharacterized protein n=1 Tax=Eretmocerus hayati TaxID=131215 RepID=A0ACC2NY34_9HYME|nr:hypothetical protein QAD02_011554 [Eretmocerus hayati]